MKWFRVCEEPHPKLVDVDNYGASDFIVMKSVRGGYGFLPTKFFNELIGYSENGVREFNYKIAPSEYRRGFVTKEYKPFYDVSIFYILRYWSLMGLAITHNYFASLFNRIIEKRAMTAAQAEKLLIEGKTVGILTHIGCARQWWFKLEDGQLFQGSFANSPKDVTNWKAWDNELPNHWRYKEAR